jgi:protocatechuate 3,4-dioxygenase beta subunit
MLSVNIDMRAWIPSLLMIGSVLLAQQPPSEPSILEGVVLDAETGAPLEGVAIYAPWPYWMPDPAPNASLMFSPTLTDKDGHFVRDNVYGRGGRASPGFSKDGYQAPFLVFTILPGERASNAVVRMQRRKSGVISGRVVDGNGMPAVNVAVTVYRCDPSRAPVAGQVARTDDRGDYRVYGLQPGRYIVGFSSGAGLILGSFPPPPGTPTATSNSIGAVLYPGVGLVSKAEVVTVRNEEETRLGVFALGLNRMGRIRFHILNSGEPAKDFSMSIGITTRRIVLNSGEDVWEEYKPDRPGPLTFALFFRENGREALVPVTSLDFDGADRDVEIDFSRWRGTLSVRTLVEQPDGSTTPFMNATSKLSLIHPGPLTSSLNITFGPEGTAMQAQAQVGNYEITTFSIPSDLYVASAHQDERDALVAGVDVSERSAPLEIRLRRGAGIFRGTLTDTHGNAVQGAKVMLLPEASSSGPDRVGNRRVDITDQYGHFEVRGITPGRYRAYASLDVDVDITNYQTVVYIDPEFMSKHRERAVPVVLEENGQIERNLTLLEK